MDAYIYQAALYCANCAENIRARLLHEVASWCGAAGQVGLLAAEDSDAYPQGPYPDGGGEADSPQHCDGCAAFLANPLTPDGLDYVCELVERGEAGDNARLYVECYGLSIAGACWHLPGCLPDGEPAIFADLPGWPSGANQRAREYIADELERAADGVWQTSLDADECEALSDQWQQGADAIRAGECDCVDGPGGYVYEVYPVLAKEL